MMGCASYDTTGNIVIDPSVKTEFAGSKLRLTGTTDKSPISYKVGETMRFRFELAYNQTLPTNKVFFLKWSRRGDDGITENGFERIVEGKPIVVETSIDRPGFVNVNARVTDLEGYGNYCYFDRGEYRVPLAWEGSAGADVDKILPSYDEPADFDDFWRKSMAELAKVPVKARLADVPTNNIPARFRNLPLVVKTFSVDCLGPRPVTGYLVYPKDAAPKSLPVQINFDGYGTCTENSGPSAFIFQPEGERKIRLHVNAHGYELMKDAKYYKDFFAKLQSYGFDATENLKPETSYFYYMALRVVRAFDFAKTLPEWNGRDLVSAGGSQAGFQTSVAGALVKGLTVATPNVTWLCDINGPSIGRIGGWRPDYRPGLAYFDSVFLTRRIPKTCKLEINRAGLGDYVCPPSGLAAQYNAADCAKRIVWMQNSSHMYVPPRSIQQCFTNEAPAGSALKGTQAAFGVPTRKVDQVKAAFDNSKWTICKEGGVAKPFDFSKRTRIATVLDGTPCPVRTKLVVRGELVAEADGEVVLGAGMDWWWECAVNGVNVFGRSIANGCNAKSAFEKIDWAFAAPVKKGVNEVVFTVWAGECGYAEAGVLPDVTEVDVKSVEDYHRLSAGFADPASVAFEMKWLDSTHVAFRTAQPAPAAIGYRTKGSKNWIQSWDTAFRTDHVVAIPPRETLDDCEFRRVEWCADSDDHTIRTTPLCK